MGEAVTRFSPDEFTFMKDFFDSGVDILRDSSCNDFTSEYTPDKAKVIFAVASHMVKDQGMPDIDEWRQKCRLNEKTLFMFDYATAAYFASRFADTALKSISPAEALVAADLLDHMADSYKNWGEGREDDLYKMNLAATPANKGFMQAALDLAVKENGVSVGPIKSAEDTISLQSHIALRYLALRCRELAAAGHEIIIESAKERAPLVKDGISYIAPLGVAPRFPPIKKYAKEAWCHVPNWQDEQLVRLQAYAEKKSNPAVSTADALNCLEWASQALRQIAIQSAFDVPVEKLKVSQGLQACIKLVAKAYEGQQRFYNGEQKDSGIAANLFVSEGYSPEEIEQAILAFHSPTSVPSQGQRDHAQKVTRMVTESSTYQEMRKKKLLAHEGMVKYRAKIGSDWHIPWRRSVAYRYWACAMALQVQGRVKLGPVHSIPTVIHCILLGWHDQARRLLQGIHAHLATMGILAWDGKTEAQRRTHLFTLRLADLWNGDAENPFSSKAQDPLFDLLLAHWRHRDPLAIAPLLLAACDRHTHSAVARQDLAELGGSEYWYDPFEIHMALYLRRAQGLENPVLDHPIMNTPLGKLPEAEPQYVESLLDGVKVRSRSEIPPLAGW